MKRSSVARDYLSLFSYIFILEYSGLSPGMVSPEVNWPRAS